MSLSKKPQTPAILTGATLVLALLLAGCAGIGTPSDAMETHEQVVRMKNVEYSPKVLTVSTGTKVTWVNDDPFGHTVTPLDAALWGTAGSGDAQKDWLMQDESWSHVFSRPGTYEYYCDPHASVKEGVATGMVGTIIVVDGAAGGAEVAQTPGPARTVDVQEIGRSGFDVPPPIGARGPEHLSFDITSSEVTAEMADGTTYTYWTFDGTVPGPMLRARVDDTITVNLHNDPSSSMGHNIDFHAVTGPGGGAGTLNAAPGETATLTFKALRPGLYVYHCAYQNPPLHIAHGMYGLILIEPAGGLPVVDREYYVFQSDFYSPFTADQKGHHEYDGKRAAQEDPTFVVFNGRMNSLTGDRQLEAEVGETVRLFVGNGGPNLVSSFHVIGEIFDRVWVEGGIGTPPQQNIQTTLVPAGGSTIVEFDVEVPGDYILVDHSIFRIQKGAVGILHVAGDDQPDTFRSGP